MTDARPIGELVSAVIDYRGKTPPKTDEGIPLITAKVIKGGRIDPVQEYVSEETYSSWMRRGMPSPGDVLVTTEAPLGEVAQVPRDDRIALAQRVILLRPDPAKVDPQFFFHFLRSPEALNRLRQRASGTTVAGIRQPELKAVLVDLLDRQSQQTVGQVLDRLDGLIDNNRRRVDVLEEMVRAIYREWFGRFRFPGHEDVRLVNSPLGPIPEGWSVGCVDDLVALSKTTVHPSAVESSTPAVGLEHIPRRQITLDDWGEAGALGSRKATFVAGDLLFGKIRPYFHKVSVAPVDGICSTDAIVLRPHVEHWGQAVLSIASDEFVAHAVQTSNGTKMPRADWKVIREFPIAIPPIETARRFTDRAHALLTHAQVLMFQARHLAALRDLLLPRLVTGRIDVADLDRHAVTESVA